MRTTQERLAGLFDVLNHAASSAAELAAYLNELIEARRDTKAGPGGTPVQVVVGWGEQQFPGVGKPVLEEDGGLPVAISGERQEEVG